MGWILGTMWLTCYVFVTLKAAHERRKNGTVLTPMDWQECLLINVCIFVFSPWVAWDLYQENSWPTSRTSQNSRR